MGMKVDSVERVLTLLVRANEEVENAVAEVYSEVGRDAVDGIRNGTMSNWQDQTGSLRSSVGCVVARRGRIISEHGFGAVLGGAQGASKGRRLARKLAAEHSAKDFCLVIVAGEEYAVYVEAVEGKAVLAQGRLYVERNIPQMLERKIRLVLDRYEK